MAGWLHGVFVGDRLFVFPLCGFSLSLFCNYPVRTYTGCSGPVPDWYRGMPSADVSAPLITLSLVCPDIATNCELQPARCTDSTKPCHQRMVNVNASKCVSVQPDGSRKMTWMADSPDARLGDDGAHVTPCIDCFDSPLCGFSPSLFCNYCFD